MTSLSKMFSTAKGTILYNGHYSKLRIYCLTTRFWSIMVAFHGIIVYNLSNVNTVTTRLSIWIHGSSKRNCIFLIIISVLTPKLRRILLFVPRTSFSNGNLNNSHCIKITWVRSVDFKCITNNIPCYLKRVVRKIGGKKEGYEYQLDAISSNIVADFLTLTCSKAEISQRIV